VQGFCFAPLILLLLSLAHLPLAILGHHISLSYGQSIQGWGSWFADWGKALLLDLVTGTFVLSVVFVLIRRSRRWWLWLWVVSLPMQLLVVFVLPLVVDPMFNHFEPLAQTHPELVQQLERVVSKTGVSIPPARMFLMKASEKYTSSNAYVTGFGSSQRVVVWDTPSRARLRMRSCWSLAMSSAITCCTISSAGSPWERCCLYSSYGSAPTL
jgi:STE24 endopeptidase